MPYASTGSTSIDFGSSLRIGYRIYGSISPFTYLSYFPSSNELPYTFEVPIAGVWEFELTRLCPSCSGTGYSDPETFVQTIL